MYVCQSAGRYEHRGVYHCVRIENPRHFRGGSFWKRLVQSTKCSEQHGAVQRDQKHGDTSDPENRPGRCLCASGFGHALNMSICRHFLLRDVQSAWRQEA